MTENTRKQELGQVSWYWYHYRLAKSWQNNREGLHFLIKMQVGSTLFVFLYFRFSYAYFLEYLLMASEHWDSRHFTLAYQNNLPFSLFSTISLLLIVNFFISPLKERSNFMASTLWNKYHDFFKYRSNFYSRSIYFI